MLGWNHAITSCGKKEFWLSEAVNVDARLCSPSRLSCRSQSEANTRWMDSPITCKSAPDWQGSVQPAPASASLRLKAADS